MLGQEKAAGATETVLPFLKAVASGWRPPPPHSKIFTVRTFWSAAAGRRFGEGKEGLPSNSRYGGPAGRVDFWFGQGARASPARMVFRKTGETPESRRMFAVGAGGPTLPRGRRIKSQGAGPLV